MAIKSKAVEYLENVNWANEQIKKKNISDMGYNYDYFVLNDIGCGEITSESLLIEKAKGKNAGYHAKIEGKEYKDPDAKSIILYMLIAHKFGTRIEDYGIRNFKVSIRGSNGENRYKYCISADYDDKNIKLTGDWVISWDIIAACEDKKQFDIVKRTQTIMGHPIWPCEQKDRRNTVNQVRKAKISMKETLDVLKMCYNNDFEKKSDYNGKSSYSNLEDAFLDYKDWYRKFKSYEEYVEFWELKCYEKTEITKDNILEVFPLVQNKDLQ